MPAYRTWLFAALGASIGVLFFRQINTGFRLQYGDVYDGVIQAVLIGHWYKVVQGLHAWNQPGYFFPTPDTLGYNDGFFLYGIAAIPFRAIGLDIFRAQEAVLIVLKIFGFLTMARLLERLISPRSLASIVGAVLFTLMIGLSNQAFHGQLLSVALAPFAFSLLLDCVTCLAQPAGRFLWRWAAFMLLIGSWLITSYYIAWFFILFCFLMLSVQAAFDLRTVISAAGLLLRDRGVRLIGATTILVVALVPFGLTYGPKLAETHGHNIYNALAYAHAITNLVNVGPRDFVWGDAFIWLQTLMPARLQGGEFSVGFTPDVLLVLGLLLASSWRNRFARLGPVLRATMLAGVILLLVPISLHDLTPWRLVYRFIPGASGVRVISRAWLFLVFPFSILLAVFIHRLRTKPGTRVAGLAIAALLIASQISRNPPTDLDVDVQLKQLAMVPAPPSQCQTFFVVNHTPSWLVDDLIYGFYHDNVAAMLIADRIDLPTINGFASFLPPHWALSSIPPATYADRVATYVDANRIERLCSYDIDAASWNATP